MSEEEKLCHAIVLNSELKLIIAATTIRSRIFIKFEPGVSKPGLEPNGTAS